MRSNKAVVKVMRPKVDEPIAAHMKSVLDELGEDSSREGLVQTPQRAAKALRYLTSGYSTNLESILNGALFTHECDEMVIIRDIEFFSMCEHHLLPFFGKVHVGYLRDVLQPRGVGVICEARHFCMMMRGVEKQHSGTMTSSMLGAFRSRKETRDEFLTLVRKQQTW
jgi:GTP cyclohydrolase I